MEMMQEKLTKEVFLRRPVLSEIYSNNSNVNLKDYVKNFWEICDTAPDPVFIEILKKEASVLYGVSAAQKVAEQLKAKPLISTIDHHGIWNHPIFVNSDLIFSLHFEPEEFALALSTESVSLNNTSSWSGSLLLHNGQNLKRHSFFPDVLKNLPVFSTPAISQKDIQRLEKNADPEILRLIGLLDINNIPALNFSQQASLLTSKLWQNVFPSAPKLLYIGLENLVLKYLISVLQDPKEFLSKVILSSKGRDSWQKYFASEHTFLFWGIDSRGRRQSLEKLPEDERELIKLIKEKKIYPSSPLCFAALLNAGMVCAGGFTQTTWLTRTKDKIVLLLKDLSLEGEKIEHIGKLPTKNFAESSLAWLSIDGKYVAPTGVDLFFSEKDLYPKYTNLAAALPLTQSIELAIPTIYSVVVPKHEQIKGFNLDYEQDSVFKRLNVSKLLADNGI